LPRYEFSGWYKVSGYGGIHVSSDLMGTVWPLRIDGFDLRLRIPMRGETGSAGTIAIDGWAGTEEDPTAVDVNLVEIRAEVDSESLPLGVGQDWRQDLDEAAKAAVRRLRAWARLEQSWIGLVDAPVTRPSLTSLRNLDAGTVEPGHGGVIEMNAIVVGGPELTRTTFERIAEAEPPTPDSFLSDALYLGIWRRPPDPQRAILIGAIACEVKAKRTLTDLAKPETRPLLEMMLDNPRSFPQAAIELFDRVPLAMFKRSLRTENLGLYKRVRNLFELRNDVAHEASPLSIDKAQDRLRAAREAFIWLDSLATPAGDSPTALD